MYNEKNTLPFGLTAKEGETDMEHATYGSGAASSGGEKWYYMDGDRKCGPVDTSEMISMLVSGELAPDTRVWTKRLGKWSPAAATNLVNDAQNQKQSAVVLNLNAQENPRPKRKKTRWWIWLIIGLLVAAILGAACFFLFFRPKAAEASEETAVSDIAEPVLTYGLENPVIFEDDRCAFLIDSIGEKGDYLELDVRCVNKTADQLSFSWDNTCVNGNMFDPLWTVYVQGNSTAKSSITFPLSTLDSVNLLPAEKMQFVLSVFNEDAFEKQQEESEKYILFDDGELGEEVYTTYRKVKGYEGYYFTWNIKVDKSGRPYYVGKDKTNIYFDEIRDSHGLQLYPTDFSGISQKNYYNDLYGRPYYFSKYGTTVYYDGYGFAFHDKKANKNYYYDENGKIAYYGTDGIPEYYEDEVSQELTDAGKPKKLKTADGNFLVHQEFTIYPTGRTEDQVMYPERITMDTEQVYWDGEKGSFIVLGGEMDEFSGYRVRTYIENNADNYIYFSWNYASVNGEVVFPDSAAALRPHSRIYRDILIPNGILQEYEIETVEEIAFRVFAVGENLAVPLYPIVWEAPTAPETK